MTQALWRLSATELARQVRARQATASEATASVLARIEEVNPRINAVVDVMAESALAAAAAADDAQNAGRALGPLHGVPITIKVNVDTAGRPTTDGIVAAKDAIAQTDSPLVAHLRQAGAIIVGRSNTPAFSLRWFTDNDLHGRTLNPFDAGITPGGSSGGAAAAVAMGMGAIAHGNDYGGSIRYPAWACGVVGLRTTAGRIASYKASAPNRGLTHQQMSVQGPLTRHVADARLALEVMAQPTHLDPGYVPVPLTFADSERTLTGLKVAVFARHPNFDVDPAVSAPVEQAARWLAEAGCVVEEIAPPHFEEAASLWRRLVMDDLRRAGHAAINAMGDAGVRSALAGYMHGLTPLSADALLEAQMRRFAILRDWGVYFEQHPVLLMPNSWQRAFRVDADLGSPSEVSKLVAAQAPLLATAMLGLPGLAVPTGVVSGLPVGVQINTARFREDIALRVGEVIESAAAYEVLAALEAR